MSTRGAKYIPALNQRWLTPLYDPLLRYVMREEVFKRMLVEQTKLKAGEQVLDLGCGTGTLTLMLSKAQPQARIVGLDGDPVVLNIARKKAQQENITAIQFDEGLAFDLPYADASFDVVVASLMLHHLTPENKRSSFKEVLRILKPGGRFHIADFGAPHNLSMKIMTTWMSRLEQTADHFQGKLLDYLLEAGFGEVSESGSLQSIFGPLSLYQAVKPQF